MVVGLGIRPSICLGQILQSSDEIRSGISVFAFGTKEFWNFIRFNSEVEISGPIGSCSVSRGRAGCSWDGYPGSGVTSVVVVSFQQKVIIVIVRAIVLGSQVNVVTS